MKQLSIKSFDKGFTLIELMITIAVAAILLGVAIPSFIDLISNNRSAKFTNELTTAFRTARSYAISQNVPTFICPSNNANNENPSCGDENTWGLGFLIYAKTSNTGVADTAYESGANNDTLIYQYSFGTSNSANISIDSVDTIDGAIGFQSDGFIWQETPGVFVTPTVVLCDKRKEEGLGTAYRFSIAGRINATSTDPDDSSIPGCNP